MSCRGVLRRAVELVVPVSLLFTGALGTQARAANYTVTSSLDVSVPGTMTLREAINAANSSPGLDTISFDIPGPGPHTIAPLTPLPQVTDPVIIDGTTQPGYAGAPIIELTGVSAPPLTDGLRIL